MNDVFVCDLLSTELDQLGCVQGGVSTDADRGALRRASGGDIAVFGLFHDGVLIGKGGADFMTAPDAARIWMVNIDEAFRSQGLGSSLMRMSEAVSVERGFTHADLLVAFVNARGKAFYERRGYHIIGEETDVLYERDSSGTPQRRDVMCYLMRKSLNEVSKGQECGTPSS